MHPKGWVGGRDLRCLHTFLEGSTGFNPGAGRLGTKPRREKRVGLPIENLDAGRRKPPPDPVVLVYPTSSAGSRRARHQEDRMGGGLMSWFASYNESERFPSFETVSNTAFRSGLMHSLQSLGFCLAYLPITAVSGPVYYLGNRLTQTPQQEKESHT